MGKRVENLKRLARKKGWLYVVRMFVTGPFIIVYVGIGYALKFVGDFMITTGNKL